MGGDDEDTLTASFRAGADTALQVLYERHGAVIYRIAMAALRSVPDAEEVTQATFVSAWRGRDTYRPELGSLPGWLVGIARRRIVDQLRTVDRDQRARHAAARPESPDPENDAQTIVDRILVADELARLPEIQRRCSSSRFSTTSPTARSRP